MRHGAIHYPVVMPTYLRVPEKTVEIWTAIAVSDLIPDSEIWSPTNARDSVDQAISAGKTWAFELKACSSRRGGSFLIRLNQLERHAFHPVHSIPVLYVLPLTPWSKRPAGLPPVEADQWKSFPDWAWVVPAVDLASYLGIAPGTSVPRNRGRFVTIGGLTGTHSPIKLRNFLEQVLACTEPIEWTLRLTENIRSQTSEDDLLVSPNSIRRPLYFHVAARHLPALPSSKKPLGTLS
jgi:hypothetical protein